MWAKFIAVLGIIIISLGVVGIVSESTQKQTTWPPNGYKDMGDVNVMHDTLQHGSEMSYAGKVSEVGERAIVLDNGSMFLFFMPIGDLEKGDVDLLKPGDKVLVELRVGELIDCGTHTGCEPNFNYSGRSFMASSWHYEKVSRPGNQQDDSACGFAGIVLGSLLLVWAYFTHRKDVAREVSSRITIDRIINRMDDEDGDADAEAEGDDGKEEAEEDEEITEKAGDGGEKGRKAEKENTKKK